MTSLAIHSQIDGNDSGTFIELPNDGDGLARSCSYLEAQDSVLHRISIGEKKTKRSQVCLFITGQVFKKPFENLLKKML